MPARSLVVVLLTALALAAAVPAAASQCPSPGRRVVPKVTVELKVGPTHYNHRYTKAQIRNIMRTDGGSTHAPGETVGLTVAASSYQVSTNGLTTRRRDGMTCLWISEVNLRLVIPEQTVYVAREFPVGSCQYNVTMEHENEHVRRNRQVVEAHAGRIGPRLEEAVRLMNPLVLQGSGNGVPPPLKEVLDGFLAEITADRLASNAAIDTPENYRRTSERCHRW